MSAFGKRLRAARERRGWSQEELAAASEVTQGYISQLESGEKAEPSIYQLRKFAAALGVNLSELLGEDAQRAAPIQTVPPKKKGPASADPPEKRRGANGGR